jgi:glycosyltransferase involved in cell wall biosynthesis
VLHSKQLELLAVRLPVVVGDSSVRRVSVVTPTCVRTDLLLRTVRSVQQQDYPNIEHIIVGDHHPTLLALRERILSINPRARIENLLTPANIFYPAQRASIARNYGISIAEGDYIAHMDDDNQMERDHVSRLVSVLEREGASAAHSWRKLFTADGLPCELITYPWAVGSSLADHVFDELVKAGICVPGSSEVRDQMTTPEGDPILHVDTSEWLIRKEVHRRIRFPERYTLRQVIQHQTEDFLLATAFYQQGVKVVSSERATLLYYLGGYSNERSARGSQKDPVPAKHEFSRSRVHL